MYWGVQCTTLVQCNIVAVGYYIAPTALGYYTLVMQRVGLVAPPPATTLTSHAGGVGLVARPSAPRQHQAPPDRLSSVAPNAGPYVEGCTGLGGGGRGVIEGVL